MKKLLALLLAMLMLLSTVAMVACQDNTPDAPVNPVPGEPGDTEDDGPQLSDDEEKANSVITRIEKIGEFAFGGIDKNLIFAPDGSYAKEYVAEMRELATAETEAK